MPFFVRMYISHKFFVPVTEEGCWKVVETFFFQERKASESFMLRRLVCLARQNDSYIKLFLAQLHAVYASYM